jgi:hypothetical protein
MTTTYCFNEAMIVLPDAQAWADHSRQFVEVETSNGTRITLIIARAPADRDSLADFLEKGLADHRSSLRGFNLLSVTERRYPQIAGVELRFQFLDKKQGPIFHHELHCVIGSDRVGFHIVSAVADAEECDAWAHAMLESVDLRGG